MKKLVEIVRYDDNGFKVYPMGGKSERFYDYTIKDIDETILIEQDKFEKNKNGLVNGCFAYAYKYNKQAISKNGILAHRYGHMKNYMYMPFNEKVYVRNIKSDCESQFIIKQKKIASSVFTIGQSSDKFIFIKMRLELVVDRINESIFKNGYVNEELSEVFLTEDQIKKYGKSRLFDRIKLRINSHFNNVLIFKNS